jgi:hypothetical protein
MMSEEEDAILQEASGFDVIVGATLAKAAREKVFEFVKQAQKKRGEKNVAVSHIFGCLNRKAHI